VPAPSRIPLAIAATVVALQALVFIVLAVVDLGGLASARVAVGVGVGVLLLILGVGLGAAALGLLRGAHAARGPVVVAQLIGLGLAWSLRTADPDTGDQRGIALAIAASALVVLGCLATGPARRALADDGAQ
jgi:hypothetical protein